MSGKRTFAVHTIGVSESEKKVLRNIFKLSLYRARSYSIHESAADGAIDIAIVDSVSASAAWDGFRVTNPAVPAIFIKAQPSPDPHTPSIRRPFVASRVLSVLDQVALADGEAMPAAAAAPVAALAATAAAPVAAPAAPVAAPAASVAAAAPVAATAAVLDANNAATAHRALVVDDSLPIRKQMEIELDLLGVSADFAESGEQATQLLGSKAYDIVFLDVVLPGVDGYRVCKDIKKNKATKTTPVVMLTSKSSPFDRVRGTFAGCDTYLTKPVAHDSFKQVVKKYLG